jgi:hypothetical protein
MSTHILTLPNELLLEIADHLPRLPRDRRAELITLTMVCKRFRRSMSGGYLARRLTDMSQTTL